MALMALMTSSVFLSCAAMFLPLELFTRSIRSNSLTSCEGALQIQTDLVDQLLTTDVPEVSLFRSLDLIARSVDELQILGNKAIDLVWGQMVTKKKFEPSWNLRSPDARREVAMRAWAEISSQQEGSPLVGIYSVLEDGTFTGYSVNQNGTQRTGLLWDAPTGGSPLTSRRTDLATGRRDGPIAYKGHVNMPNIAQPSLDKAAKVKRTWSPVFAGRRSPFPSMYWTAPIAYCGTYACMEGVLSAEMSLKMLSAACRSAFAEVYSTLHLQRSSETNLFLIQASTGRVMAEVTENSACYMQKATDCPEGILRSAAQYILKQFGSFDSLELTEYRMMNFSQTSPSCEGTSDCYVLGTRSIQLDSQTRWLAVAVLPSKSFTGVKVDQDAALAAKVASIDASTQILEQARARGRDILLVMTVLSIAISLAFSRLVSKPLRHLTETMMKLGELDFTESSMILDIRRNSRRVRVREVLNLQLAFCRLARGISTFARFVPETVVRNIVMNGEGKGTRLEVSRRMVTIMCTDIKGFTSISERLRPRDLLYMLMRYFSVMMRVVELYGGVVSEILGDGLIVFWNSPDTVEDHPGKACAAALTQLEALQGLNGEYGVYGLPDLSIRIGIHTGSSLVGNIGSESRMKYGCLGDTKQVAMKLEDLCKYYGVDIICSSTTRNMTIPSRFLFRQLDYVQLQPDADQITLYEVICRDEIDDNDIDSTRDAGSRYSLSVRDMASDATPGSGSLTSDVQLSQPSLPSIQSEVNMGELVNVTTNRREMLHRWLAANMQETNGERLERGEAIGTPRLACGAVFDHTRTTQSNRTAVTEQQRKIIGQYEKALKAFHDGDMAKCIQIVTQLLDEKEDPPSRKLLEIAGERQRAECACAAEDLGPTLQL